MYILGAVADAGERNRGLCDTACASCIVFCNHNFPSLLLSVRLLLNAFAYCAPAIAGWACIVCLQITI
ncbi:hypothetical protein Y032_0015g2719 [Ancylostoma ceylanicum]|uniref:Uncharacterized protein n=1 Tax=Ancylostoma ceylanicum TaxID=53326 RepID=A0A016V7F5_9BILA|nr:hypothetical protein Y032_0015g2719 [Ancylostoma ceylanicum]